MASSEKRERKLKPENGGQKNNIIRLSAKDKPSDPAVLSYDPRGLVFALDIGTRTVVGIAGIREKEKFRIVASAVIEHKSRAMFDGQIHDISQVASVVGEIREKLEKKLGTKLTKVAIAAAGRVLKTCEIKAERDTDPNREIDRELVSSLELEAIQLAQAKLYTEMPGEDQTQFYCVGYSVTNYYLNGYIITSLIGHRGKKAGVDVLATFLPHTVVESLYTVVNKAGLEVSSLTLEPIAAINVTIPKDLRLLNLALVDIGAGTSDIAITRDGSVTAYAMVPVAGDEITERIAQHYLVDFNTGERIKIMLSSPAQEIVFDDIFGKRNVVSRREVNEVIKPGVSSLAEVIAGKILEYNHKSPNAVFLIGGGSQTPGLAGAIASNLGLPEDRVVVRSSEIIRNVAFRGKTLSGPEAVTPIGIAVTAQTQMGEDFFSVTVNGKKIRLFNSRRMTVADALLLVGYDAEKLIGRSGKSVSFVLNGEKRTVRGEYGKAAEIFVNGMQASLETAIKINDEIVVKPAQNGKDAEAKVSDVVGFKAMKVLLNGSKIDAGTKVLVNGTAALPESRLKEGDTVSTVEISTVGELLKAAGIDAAACEISVNGKTAQPDQALRDGDNVMYNEKKQHINAVNGVGPEMPEGASKTETPGNVLNLVINGNPTAIKALKEHYIFVDIFNHIDFDISKPQGNIILRLNGKPAAFTDEIRQGDSIEVFWEKQANKV